LFIAQPKQIPAHDPGSPFKFEIRIILSARRINEF
jgi:hypothetical protein